MTITERRRSDRLMLTIPLLVRGVDSKGEVFETQGRTIMLNRNGAQIQTPYPLRSGQTIRLTNLVGHCGGDFRVVGAVSPPRENSGEFVVECLDSNNSIWEIQFPPARDNGDTSAKALLECRICHKLAMGQLSSGEVEVLRTAGVVAKRCQTCNAVTPFRYADFSIADQEPLGDLSWIPAMAGLARQRLHRRVYLQLPVSVRDLEGRVEVARTENVSRGGFCFTSAKDYQVEQGLTLVFPGGASGWEVEMSARIVRSQAMAGTNRKIYGARYEPREQPDRGEASSAAIGAA